jgi:FtsZ-interacting cell division protein YlmF
MSLWKKGLYYMGLRDDGDDLDYIDELPAQPPVRAAERPEGLPVAPRPTPETMSPAPTFTTPRSSGVTVLDGRIPPRTPSSSSTPPTPPRGVQSVRPTLQSQSEVTVFMPKSFAADGQSIADAIRTRQIVVINFGQTLPEDRRRISDFCAGVVYMIGGRMKRLQPTVIMVEPKSVEVPDAVLSRLRATNYTSS